MNFLGHVYLSGNNPDLLFGNYIGDFVKGKQFEEYPENISRGILLHRDIDRYTDEHPAVSKSKDRLRKKYRHYSGVIVDIFYDHFLANLWLEYHATPLKVFTEQVYDTVRARKKYLPEKAELTFKYMSSGNWLLHYGRIEGIEQALSGLARRTRFDSGMEEAGYDLKQHYGDFRSEFRRFLPDVKSYVHKWIEEEASN